MEKEICHKVYFGNLPIQTTEPKLREFLNQNGLISTITLRKGYAFVECANQATADIIVDSYQGKTFMGNLLVVEPAFRGPRKEVHIYSRPLLAPSRSQPTILLRNPFCPYVERTYLYIPKHFVGKILGPNGSTIRGIIRESGASLKIENSVADDPEETERRVTISGLFVESHWRAQYLLFHKLTEDGRLPPDLKLTLELTVPTDAVGRLIGRGGARIKALRTETGATIKVLTDETDGNDTFTQLYGNFDELYAAQMKIHQIIRAHKRRHIGCEGQGDSHAY